jgi:hypothetical protein
MIQDTINNQIKSICEKKSAETKCGNIKVATKAKNW